MLYSYFNLDDGRMETDHVWDASIYPEAEGVSLNYYTKNGLAFADIDALEDGAAALLSGEQPEHLEVQVGDYDADVYTKENVQFLFRDTDASSVNWITAGKAPYTTLYFTFYY